MKNILILLFFAQAAFAQNTGTVKYHQIIKIKVSPEMKAALRGVELPDQKSDFKLTFAEDESIYKKLQKKHKETSAVIMMGGNADYSFYVNLAEKTTLEQKEFLGKKFLISGDWKKGDWKMSGDTKVILGHPCLKATKTDTSGVIVAWFAMDVKAPYGPREFGQLPGLILEMKVYDNITIVATELNLAPLAEVIKKPKKGKKVTQEKFKVIQKEKLKELQESRSGSKNSNIIHMGG